MNIKFKDKLKALIDAYKEVGVDYAKQLRTALEAFNDADIQRRFTNEGIVEAAQEAKDDIVAEWDAVGKVYNQKARLIVEEVKEAIANEIMNLGSKPSDYAIKVNNALQFLQLEDSESLTDDVAYNILRDFLDDYEQMGHFKRVIVKKKGYYNPDEVYYAFPKTFEAYEKADSILKVFSKVHNEYGDSLDGMIEDVFIHPKTETTNDFIYAGGSAFTIPDYGYTEIAHWDYIVKCSEAIENIVSEY